MPEARPLRADARRNRDRLLEVAVRRFAEAGEEEVSLDSIAREAGVGIGTLYRHFPTREALVLAAYHNEVARLCDAAGDLLDRLSPAEALRVWMDRFLDYVTAKRGMADALRAVVASGGDPFRESRGRMLAALGRLLEAGMAAGQLRPGVDPADILMVVTGIAMAAREPEQRERASRLLDLVLDGLRHRAPAAG